MPIDEGDDNSNGDDDDNCYSQEEEDTIGEVTLRSRQRVRSFSPSRIKTTARNVAHSKDARMRIRASTLIPRLSEGMLPPDAKPVNSYEALHHLSKRVSMSLVSDIYICLFLVVGMVRNSYNYMYVLFALLLPHLSHSFTLSLVDERLA